MLTFTSNRSHRLAIAAFAIVLVLAAGALAAPASPDAATNEAQQILEATGVPGGLVVHLGCGDGRLTAALRAGSGYLVLGLTTDDEKVATARRYVQSQDLYGPVSIDRFDGKRLPLIDNLANLVVAEDLGQVTMEEVVRALCPGGVAYVKRQGEWTKTVKPRPEEIDDWTHYLHDASNNAVAHDKVVGPPRRMQWLGSPRYARHHDRMSSVSAVVSSGGRVFTIFDEATPASILIAPKWALIARDAFNGTILWRRPIKQWHTHLWPLKSGPAQLPRRLVAQGDRVYVTLALEGPLEALDAATGKTLRTYEGTEGTEEVILRDGVLFLMATGKKGKADATGFARANRGYGAKFWDEEPRQLMAVRADSGEVLWSHTQRVLPGTLATDGRRVVFHDGQSVVCLDPESGKEAWRSGSVDRSAQILAYFVPTLVLYEDVVLFAGGERAGNQTGSWYTDGKDTLTALSADTGKTLWTANHPPSGYRSPEDVLVMNGLVWTGETTSGRAIGVFTGRDPYTGKIKSQFPPDVKTYWFHHRCYRGKATDNYLLMSRTGIEFIDVRNEHWITNHWVRGACLYGIMPANGLIYAPQHPCACYLEAKLYGFNALAPASAGPRIPKDLAAVPRLDRGPAYDTMPPFAPLDPEDWPTLRHDAARSGRASTTVPTELKPQWQTDLGGRLTSPVVAGGRVFLASIDRHTVHALDAGSGQPVWQFTAGGRVDSPPTVYQGRVLFGSADGYVYCLRAEDGVLAWRFRAAPMDQRLSAFEQVESVWPVHGSVLVLDGVVYCAAGRSMFLDDGIRLLRLDVLTGRLLSETIEGEREEKTGKDIQSFVSWLNMPAALPDVLVSDGRLVYMRSQPYRLDGTRLPLEAMPSSGDADHGAPAATQRADRAHLFSPTGLLDDTWWHRTYWVYGSRFVSGWCGYFKSGKVAPAGRILVFDDSTVYGFGRKPKFYRWTTPIEHQLFAAEKPTAEPKEEDPVKVNRGESQISVEKSASLNPANRPVTVAAWVNSEKPDGVVFARGGGAKGYVLYLKKGKPHFAIRTKEGLRSVAARQKIVGRWVHLAGVLAADGKLQIYVDGKLGAAGAAIGLLASDPQEGIEIGADAGSTIGDYDGRFPLAGRIDEVVLYRRALDSEEIAGLASASAATKIDATELVLRCTFEKGTAADSSGAGNNGQMENATAVAGKVGRAMKFTGAGGERPADFTVAHRWIGDLPLLARAMVLSGETLFVAGPPDLVDEEKAFRQMADPEVRRSLAEQDAALAGRKGALLWAVSIADGRKLSEHRLAAPPVFDGMVAAGGRLLLSTTDGKVLCLGK